MKIGTSPLYENALRKQRISVLVFASFLQLQALLDQGFRVIPQLLRENSVDILLNVCRVYGGRFMCVGEECASEIPLRDFRRGCGVDRSCGALARSFEEKSAEYSHHSSLPTLRNVKRNIPETHLQARVVVN